MSQNGNQDGTFGITGIPPPHGLKPMTKKIPYVPGMPLRVEITELATKNDSLTRKQWTLYVLGLEAFKAVPIEKKLSYFQVAGIHGYPELPWDGAPAPKQSPVINPKPGEDRYGGYCVHNALNFPTWHRPYMLLFEQLMWRHMKDIIEGWGLQDPQEATAWNEAADKWRLPYWDWARRQSYTQDFSLPAVFTKPQVRIWPPSQVSNKYPSAKTYANPLWGFDNPETDDDGVPLPFGNMPAGKTQFNIKNDPADSSSVPANKEVMPWARTNGVGRYGIFITSDRSRYSGLEGVNNTSAANFGMETVPLEWYGGNPGTLSDSISRMFSPAYNKTWGTFASTKWNAESESAKKNGKMDNKTANDGTKGEEETEDGTGYLSLEYIHNNIHNISGGSEFKTGVGHMSDVPVAAFDPLFWLHHCQIDRLLAMWQALYWDLWWDKQEPDHDDPERTNINVPDAKPSDKLWPFHTKDNGDPDEDVWTSDMCRDWTKLGYQYDNLLPKRGAVKPDGTLDEEQYRVDLQTYIAATYPGTWHLVDAILNKQKENAPEGLMLNDSDGNFRDFIINVEYDRYALNGRSYSIKFYLGGPKNQNETIFSRENMIGQVYSFSGGARDPAANAGCANCETQAEAKVMSRAQVPITLQLMHHVLDDEDDHPIDDFLQVEKYLELHLRWKYVQLGGLERPASDFPNTKISVWKGAGRPRAVPRSPSERNGFTTAEPVRLPTQYHGYEPVHNATEDKVGGLASDDPVLGVAAFAV